MKRKRNICENCKTGKEALELDNGFPMCPYITNWKNNKCSFYFPLEPENNGFLNKILTKLEFKF